MSDTSKIKEWADKASAVVMIGPKKFAERLWAENLQNFQEFGFAVDQAVKENMPGYIVGAAAYTVLFSSTHEPATAFAVVGLLTTWSSLSNFKDALDARKNKDGDPKVLPGPKF